MRNLLFNPVSAIILKAAAFLFLIFNFNFTNVLVLFVLITAYDAILDHYKNN
jgi:hypothetical protein